LDFLPLNSYQAYYIGMVFSSHNQVPTLNKSHHFFCDPLPLSKVVPTPLFHTQNSIIGLPQISQKSYLLNPTQTETKSNLSA